MTKEDLLKIWFDSEPTARSPYGLYGYPPMWATFDADGKVCFTCPGKTQERAFPGMPYREVDGVHYQWQENGRWIGQGYQATFDDFLENVAGKAEERV